MSAYTAQAIINIRAELGKGKLFQLTEKCMPIYAKKSDGKKGSSETVQCYFVDIVGYNPETKTYDKFPSIKFEKCLIKKISMNESSDGTKSPQLTIMPLTDKDLAVTDYSAMIKPKLLEENAKYIQALDIIEEEYRCIAKELIDYTQSEDAKYTLLGNSSTPDISGNSCVNSFKQTQRKIGDADKKKGVKSKSGKVELTNAIYRFKFPTIVSNKKTYISRKGKDDAIFPIIKDATYKPKTMSDPKTMPFKVNGDTVTIDNLESVCTRYSICVLVLNLNSICLSTMGISLSIKVNDMSLVRHKPIEIASNISATDNDELAEIATASNDFTTSATKTENDSDCSNSDEEQQVQQPIKANITIGNKKKQSQQQQQAEEEHDDD